MNAKHIKCRTSCFFVALLLCILSDVQQASAAGVFGPILPYTSFADSPFSSLTFSYFHLEAFESGSFPSAMSPGVSASAGAIVGPGLLVDSVDGGGNNGHSFFSGDGSAGITFTFDKNVLGQLPTHVAIAWTDGDGPNRTFEAFDANSQLIGTIIDSTPSFFDSGDGNPENYRLFGAIDSTGISSIFIANDGGGIEVDHLQYGLISSTPEPSSLVLAALAFAGLAAWGWRER